MKLQKLIIRNFRGLKGDNNIINFSESDTIFLIGQNNVGKTTYLKAYEYFINPKQKVEISDFYNREVKYPIEIEGWFYKEDGDETDKDLNSKEPNWMEKWCDSEKIIKIKKRWEHENESFSKYTFNPHPDTKDWQVNGFGGLETILTKYAPTPIYINAMEDEATLCTKVNDLLAAKFLKNLASDYSEDYNEIKNRLNQLQQKLLQSTNVAQMNDDLNRNFKALFSNLSLKIDVNEQKELKLEDFFKKSHTITVSNDSSDVKFSCLQNGHGVIRQALFNFISFLVESSKSSKKEYLILFEEPELFLHPKIAYRLRKILYQIVENSPYQVLCATHSPLMIDISKPHSSLIRITKDNTGNTFSFQVGDEVFSKNEEQKQRIQMINRFNPYICEVFYADKVLLVEGDTEAIVYRDLLDRFYSDQEIYVLNTGSKNNIPFFQEILTAFEIEHYVIHDTDCEIIQKTGRKNPAWILNEKIWAWVETANKKRSNLARRYVHIPNFERAHHYEDNNVDKPLRAFQWVQNIKNDTVDIPDCLKWLKDIVGEQKIFHDMDYIVQNAKTESQVDFEINKKQIEIEDCN